MDNLVDLSDMRIFCTVARAGGITAACKSLKITKQSLSRKLALYEEKLGVMLIARNTRDFQLTTAGQEYFLECTEVIERANQAVAKVQSLRTDPRGTIRIHLPEALHSSVFIGLLSRFIEDNPLIKLQIVSSTTCTNLIKDSLDIQFCIGKLDDSSFIARSLGYMDFIHVAPRNFLPSIEGSERDCFISMSEFDHSHFKKPMNTNNTILHVDNMNLCKQFIMDGRGHSILPFSLCQKELLDQSLQQINKDWQEAQEVNLVFLKNKFIQSNMKKLINFLVEQTELLKPWKYKKIETLVPVIEG